MEAREKLNEFAELRGWNKNKLIGWSEAADFGEWLVKNNAKLQPVSGCFYLQSEKLPDNSGEYEVITNRGRVIKIKYKLFEDNGIWECEYGEHEINESVVAWRFKYTNVSLKNKSI